MNSCWISALDRLRRGRPFAATPDQVEYFRDLGYVDDLGKVTKAGKTFLRNEKTGVGHRLHRGNQCRSRCTRPSRRSP